MDRERLLKLESAFDRLAVLPADVRRRELLELSSTDRDLADDVARMLASDPSSLEGLFGQLAREHSGGAGAIGPVIEGFTLLSVIGEGGFGVVYLAEQAGSLRRFVAIKVLRSVVQSPTSLARFRDECGALALMDHPYVVGAIGSGVTDDGRPYLVMPLVSGLPILEFCREHRLDSRSMARLMQRVVRGLEYVHARGVIHRDLKPANILVHEVDGEPTPRLIDFGLAKAVEGKLSPHATLTTDGQRVGTMQYMSPEQAMALPVDVRSDIYSAGLIFYELLSGTPAISRERVELAASLGDFRGLHAEPYASPSRSTGPRLARELEWIVLRCLERDPARRYPTAAALAEDLERFIDGGAVSAGPPARMYRVWCWIRRHRAAVAAAASILLAMVATTGVSLRMAGRERQARVEAEQVTAFAKSIVDGLDPMLAQGRDRSLILEALKRAEAGANATPRTPAVRLQTLTLLAQAYLNVGEAAAGFRLAREARDITSKLYPPSDVRWLRAHALYVSAARDAMGPYPLTEELKPTADEVLARVRQAFPRGTRERAEVLLQLGEWGWSRSDPEDRIRSLAELHKDLQAGIGPADRLTLRAARWRARNWQPHWAEALQLLRETRQLAEQTYGPDDPDALSGLGAESHFIAIVEGLPAAVDHLQRHLATTERMLGPIHKTVVMSYYNLADNLVLLDRLDEARPIVQANIDRTRRAFGEDSLFQAYAWGDLYLLALKARELRTADEALDQLRRIAIRSGDPEVPFPELLLEFDTLKAVIAALDAVGRAQRSDAILEELERRDYADLKSIRAQRARP